MKKHFSNYYTVYFLGEQYFFRSNENDPKLYFAGNMADVELFDFSSPANVVPGTAPPWNKGGDFVCQGRVGFEATALDPIFQVNIQKNTIIL